MTALQILPPGWWRRGKPCTNLRWPTRTASRRSTCPLITPSGNSAVTLPGMRMRANNTWLCSAPTSLRCGRFEPATRNVRIWRHRWNESVWIPPCIGRSARQQPPLIWMTTSCKLKSCKGYGRPVPSEISGAPCRKAESSPPIISSMPQVSWSCLV